MYRKISLKDNKGVALIITMLLMSLILFLSIYFLTFSLTEKKIAHSQSWGVKTYYLAEAGIYEMVWRLKNDEGYKVNFETIPDWTTSFVRNNPFGAGSGSYTVTIVNSSLAHGKITAIGIVDMGNGKTSQRIVETFVYKAIVVGGEINTGDSALLADNDFDTVASEVVVVNGSIHSNNDVTAGIFSSIDVDNDIRAVDEFDEHSWAEVNVGGEIYDNHDYPPPPDSLGLPPVSFNDPEDPDSLKNQALANGVVYTEDQFKDLLDNAGGSLTLNGPITYVTGDIDFRGNPDITVNGLLVADGTIIIGKPSWFFIIPYCPNGNTRMQVNHTEGQAAGIFSQESVKFSFCSDDMEINGIIYASIEIKATEFDLFNPGDIVNINGGIFSRDIVFSSISQPINITLNSDIIGDTLGATDFSPIITVEHWEEEY